MKTFFEVGECYMANESGFEPVRVLSRTPKTIIVENAFKHISGNGGYPYLKRVKIAADGSEYIRDNYTDVCWLSWKNLKDE